MRTFKNPVIATFIILATLITIFWSRNYAKASDVRPNFIVIVSDDQRFDQFTSEFMPQTFKSIVEKGSNFANAYITNPACCPSRSSILTGKYNSLNKVYGNRYPLPSDQKTVAHYLRTSGYKTGLIGKFLNSWNGTPRPEYDYWFSHKGALVDYFDPEFNENGTFQTHEGYVTDIITDRATKFIDSSVASNKPFFLFLTPNAPHEPAIPSKKYQAIYQDLALPKRDNFNNFGHGKPEHITTKKLLSEKKEEEVAEFNRDQLRSLRSVDDMVQAIVNSLERNEVLDNTAIFYISDNGVFLGEYGLRGKSKVYEPAIHVPMALRYDGKCKAGLKSDALVANIDITPTILHFARIPIPMEINGKSLQQACSVESAGVHKELLIESWGNRGKRGNKGFMALHSGDAIYIENEDDIEEYYRLDIDPLQLNNRIDIGNYLADIENKKTKLNQLVTFLRGEKTYRIDATPVDGFQHK